MNKNHIFYVRGTNGIRLATFVYTVDKENSNLTFACSVRNPKDRDNKPLALEIAKQRLAKNKHTHTMNYSGTHDYEDVVKAVHSYLLTTKGPIKNTHAVPRRIMKELEYQAKYANQHMTPKQAQAILAS